MMQHSHHKGKEAVITREGMEESKRFHPIMMSHPERSQFRASSSHPMFPFVQLFVKFFYSHAFNSRIANHDSLPGTFRPQGSDLVSQLYAL